MGNTNQSFWSPNIKQPKNQTQEEDNNNNNINNNNFVQIIRKDFCEGNYEGLPGLPDFIVDKILDKAEFWDVLKQEKQEEVEIFSSTEYVEQEYLSFTIPEQCRNPRQIVVKCRSHDQGWCSDPDAGCWSWGDLKLLDLQGNVIISKHRIYNNEISKRDWQNHQQIFYKDDEIVKDLKPGMKLSLRICCQFGGWSNSVDSSTIIVKHFK